MAVVWRIGIDRDPCSPGGRPGDLAPWRHKNDRQEFWGTDRLVPHLENAAILRRGRRRKLYYTKPFSLYQFVVTRLFVFKPPGTAEGGRQRAEDRPTRFWVWLFPFWAEFRLWENKQECPIVAQKTGWAKASSVNRASTPWA